MALGATGRMARGVPGVRWPRRLRTTIHRHSNSMRSEVADRSRQPLVHRADAMAPRLVGACVKGNRSHGSLLVVRARCGDGVVGAAHRASRRERRLADVLVEGKRTMTRYNESGQAGLAPVRSDTRRYELPMPIQRTHLQRFWQKVRVTPECWEWTAFRTPRGYGRFSVGIANYSAHRWLYEQLVGPIPDGLTLDHLCRNPSCVRPDHLEPVTGTENTLRGVSWSAQNKRKTHCPKGHPYDDTNTFAQSTGRAQGKLWRGCRQCERVRMAIWREANRESQRQYSAEYRRKKRSGK